MVLLYYDKSDNIVSLARELKSVFHTVTWKFVLLPSFHHLDYCISVPMSVWKLIGHLMSAVTVNIRHKTDIKVCEYDFRKVRLCLTSSQNCMSS